MYPLNPISLSVTNFGYPLPLYPGDVIFEWPHKQSGINMEHFKAHSTRSASSSKAQIGGTDQLNLHGRNFFIVRILKTAKPLKRLF